MSKEANPNDRRPGIPERRTNARFVHDVVDGSVENPHCSPQNDEDGNIRLPGFMRAMARTYGMWIADQLMNGHCVNIYGVGTIIASFRKARTTNGRFQPDQFVLKLRPNIRIRQALKDLAANPDGEYFDMPKVSEIKRIKADRGSMIYVSSRVNRENERLDSLNRMKKVTRININDAPANQLVPELDLFHQPSRSPAETAPSIP